MVDATLTNCFGTKWVKALAVLLVGGNREHYSGFWQLPDGEPEEISASWWQRACTIYDHHQETLAAMLDYYHNHEGATEAEVYDAFPQVPSTYFTDQRDFRRGFVNTVMWAAQQVALWA